MVDISIIGGAISNVLSICELAKGILAANKDAAVNAKATELVSIILELQGSLLKTHLSMIQMQDELRNAKEEQSRRAQFDRYELVEPYKGTRLYGLKADAAQDKEPPHFICPNCKDLLNMMSILQEDGSSAYCKNSACGQVFDIAPEPTYERQLHDPYSS